LSKTDYWFEGIKISYISRQNTFLFNTDDVFASKKDVLHKQMPFWSYAAATIVQPKYEQLK